MQASPTSPAPISVAPLAVVIGASRGIGAEVAKILGEGGAQLIMTYRQHAARTSQVAEQIRQEVPDIADVREVQLDISEEAACRAFADKLKSEGAVVGALILSASGGLEANRDDDYPHRVNTLAPARLIDLLLPQLSPGGVVVYLTSHEAHFYDPDLVYPAYRRVAESKKAGERAVLERLSALAHANVTLNIVSADLVEDSFTAKLLEMSGHGIIAYRRDMVGGGLPTSRDVAAYVANLCLDAPAEHGSVGYVGLPGNFYTNRLSDRLPESWPSLRGRAAARTVGERITLPWRSALPAVGAVGIDIGGTKTAIAVNDKDGFVIERIPTPAAASALEIDEWITALIERFGGAEQACIAVPGIVRDDIVIACDVVPGLTGWSPTEKTGRPVALVNDAVASLLGARQLADYKGGCLLVAAGTGIGGAFAPSPSQTDILSLEPGYTPATVLGRMPVLQLDDVASGRAICSKLDCRLAELPRMLARGNAAAIAACDEAGEALGRAIGGWINLLAPPRTLVVGGLSQSEPYWTALQRGVQQTRMPGLAEACTIEQVGHGQFAGVVGAYSRAVSQGSSLGRASLHASHLQVVVNR
jgi:3-oxoacyl-[acyl-carrier protein] reductase